MIDWTYFSIANPTKTNGLGDIPKVVEVGVFPRSAKNVKQSPAGRREGHFPPLAGVTWST